MKTDSGEVSDDDEEQEDTSVMNGDCKLERQNSKQGSLKRQIGKVRSCVKSMFSLQKRTFFNCTGQTVTVMYALYAKAKIKVENTSSLNRIKPNDFCNSDALLCQLSYQTNWSQSRCESLICPYM